jgi:hypothetical protein
MTKRLLLYGRCLSWQVRALMDVMVVASAIISMLLLLYCLTADGNIEVERQMMNIIMFNVRVLVGMSSSVSRTDRGVLESQHGRNNVIFVIRRRRGVIPAVWRHETVAWSWRQCRAAVNTNRCKRNRYRRQLSDRQSARVLCSPDFRLVVVIS